MVGNRLGGFPGGDLVANGIGLLTVLRFPHFHDASVGGDDVAIVACNPVHSRRKCFEFRNEFGDTATTLWSANDEGVGVCFGGPGKVGRSYGPSCCAEGLGHTCSACKDVNEGARRRGRKILLREAKDLSHERCLASNIFDPVCGHVP